MVLAKDSAAGGTPSRPVHPTSAMFARAHLECTAGPEKGRTFRLAPAVTVIGRDAACDVVLSEATVSRQHARIERRGEEWIVKNLSPNGTLLGKKSIDEVVLADGDEIRVGAKTRLQFVVEAVTGLGTGRPQFRPRSSEVQAGPPDAEAAGREEEETKPSLFRRRKGLFIGLGAYLAAMVILGVVLALYTGGGAIASREVPILGLDDMIRDEPGAKPLRIVRESPEGVWCEGPLGGPSVLVRFEDLRPGGKADRITGIRKALDVKFTFEFNDRLAEQRKQEAIEMYRLWRLPDKEGNLFGAVRRFQKALGCYGGRGFFPGDPAADKIYQQALTELIAEVQKEYSDAIVNEKAGDYKRAWEKYSRILRLVPDRDNPIFDNVSRRMTDLKRTAKGPG